MYIRIFDIKLKKSSIHSENKGGKPESKLDKKSLKLEKNKRRKPGV